MKHRLARKEKPVMKRELILSKRVMVVVILMVNATFGFGARISDRFAADGELRLRYEFMEGFNDKSYGSSPKVGESRDGYLLSRFRLGATCDLTPDLLFKLSVQDSRAVGWAFTDSDWYSKEFGMENNPQKDSLDLFETYLEACAILESFSVKVGRQRIALGDNRIFGPGEWKNSGKWIWDALRISYANGPHSLDLFYGQTLPHDPDAFSLSHRHGYEGAGLYGHYAWDKVAMIEPVLVYKHNGEGEASYKEFTHYYMGVRIYNDTLERAFFNGTFIRQWGQRTALDGETSDVEAFGWHLEAGAIIKSGAQTTRIGCGYAYGSGDDSETATIERFDAVFGASDLYYGRMNLIAWSNVKDAHVFILFRPFKKLEIKTEYHYFKMAEKSDAWRAYKNTGDREKEDLGEEFDGVVKYDLHKNVALQAGYGHFWPGGFIRKNVPEKKGSDWCFFQTMCRF